MTEIIIFSLVFILRMNNYEDLRRLQNSVAAPMLNAGPQESPSKLMPRPLNPPDYHHAMQSRLVALKSPDHQSPNNSGSGIGGLSSVALNRKSPSSYASRSEDELSAGSGNSLSPRSRRRHHKNNSSAGTLTPSSGSSRNQSPRLLVEAKLKSGANGANGGICSPSIQQQLQQKRSSTNLQEELLRLISPDADEPSDAVIVTHARPVVAVPTTPDAATTTVTSNLPEDGEEMDWSRLVHAAARAIQGTVTTNSSRIEEVRNTDLPEGEDEDEDPTRDGSDNHDSLTSWIDDVTEKLRLEAEAADAHSQGYLRQPYIYFLFRFQLKY